VGTLGIVVSLVILGILEQADTLEHRATPDIVVSLVTLVILACLVILDIAVYPVIQDIADILGLRVG
jgi:hypothetical protein